MVAAARSSAPASLLRPSQNAAHGAGFGLARTVALAHLGSGTPPRTGAVPGPCLEMANMEQSTTAALLLLIKNHGTRLRNTRRPSFSGSRHNNAAACTCDLGCPRRAAVALIAAARLKAQARDTKTATKHKTTPPLHDPRASHSPPAFIKFCERSAARVVVHT